MYICIYVYMYICMFSLLFIMWGVQQVARFLATKASVDWVVRRVVDQVVQLQLCGHHPSFEMIWGIWSSAPKYVIVWSMSTKQILPNSNSYKTSFVLLALVRVFGHFHVGSHLQIKRVFVALLECTLSHTPWRITLCVYSGSTAWWHVMPCLWPRAMPTVFITYNIDSQQISASNSSHVSNKDKSRRRTAFLNHILCSWHW